MKLSEIWNYFRHRKGFLGLVLVTSIAVGVIGCRFLGAQDSVPRVANLQTIEASTNAYDNNLSFMIFGQDDKVAYQLNFSDSFRKATIVVSDVPLVTESYVRIFDQLGNFMAGEYTDTNDDENVDSQPIYRFGDAPKAYTLTLTPGAIVELHASQVHFYSSLTGQEAMDFRPESATERYVVTENGLRKEQWNPEMGTEAMYTLLRTHLIAQIEQYQAQATPEVLENKELDVANKTRVLLAYYALRPEDQVPYQEFINLVENGKQLEAPGADDEPGETPFTPAQPVEEQPEIAMPEVVAETAEVAPTLVTNISHASLGAGVNREEESDVVNTDDAEGRDIDTSKASDRRSTTEATQEETTIHATDLTQQTATISTDKKPGLVKIVIWVALGILIIVAFGKFILDHYVR